MPTFNMAQTPNGQPTGAEAVYSNGIPHTYPGRKLFNELLQKLLVLQKFLVLQNILALQTNLVLQFQI